jgi:hypothetical protein
MSFQFMKKSIDELKQDLLNKKPVNWESMQDADQRELAELNKQEYLEELKQLREDNPTQDDYMRDVGMSHSDFI